MIWRFLSWYFKIVSRWEYLQGQSHEIFLLRFFAPPGPIRNSRKEPERENLVYSPFKLYILYFKPRGGWCWATVAAALSVGPCRPGQSADPSGLSRRWMIDWGPGRSRRSATRPGAHPPAPGEPVVDLNTPRLSKDYERDLCRWPRSFFAVVNWPN